MTTSSTKINQWPINPVDPSQDADWVMVNEDGHLTNDSFEVIDAAEARCWCGGSDAERCRRQGHTWPLCNVDQSKLWPKRSEEVHYQPHEKDEPMCTDSESSRDQSADEQSNGNGPREAREKPQNGIDQPGFYESGPFTKLSVLTDILDKGRYSGA